MDKQATDSDGVAGTLANILVLQKQADGKYLLILGHCRSCAECFGKFATSQTLNQRQMIAMLSLPADKTNQKNRGRRGRFKILNISKSQQPRQVRDFKTPASVAR